MLKKALQKNQWRRGVVLALMVCSVLGLEQRLTRDAQAAAVNRLSVSADKRYLVESDGTPVFLMGEAAWTMPENCTREDVDDYLADRKTRGFNYVQISPARDLNGESLAPNSTRTMNSPNRQGHVPFAANANGKADITRPITVGANNPNNPDDYWDHLEYIIQKATSLNMYVALLPTWGKYYINVDTVRYPTMQLFTSATARTYGRFLGERYKNYPQIIWMLGGDMQRPTEFIGELGLEIYRALAEGIAQGMAGLATAPAWNQSNPVWDQVLITTHYGGSAYEYFNGDAWLKLNASEVAPPNQYSHIAAGYANTPTRPTVLTEGRYEGWIYDNTYHFPLEMRQQPYQCILGGALAGFAYGMAMSAKAANDQIFRFQTGWRNRLSQEGADDMRHVVALLNNLKNQGIEWWTLVPDPTAITGGQGEGSSIKAAARTKTGNALVVYFPAISNGDIDLRKITSHLRASATWFDPQSGNTAPGGVWNVNQTINFLPPVAWQDAVLIIQGTAMALQDPPARTYPEFKTDGGQVVLAAENYSFAGGIGGEMGTWNAEQILGGYLHTSYLRSSLDKPAEPIHLIFYRESANLNYVIDFKETGRYYIHLRTYAEDHTGNGYFATLDGKEVNYGGVNPTTNLTATFIYTDKTSKWTWYTDGGGTEGRGLKVSFDVATPGKHTFSLYRRDVGSRIDHIWLTKNQSIPQNTATLPLPEPSLFYSDGGTPDIHPVIDSFLAATVAIKKARLSWEVSSTSGLNLDRVEIWRTHDSQGTPLAAWSELAGKEQVLSSLNIHTHTGFVEDGTPDAAVYWYKIKVFDQQQNQAESTPQRVDVSVLAPQAPRGLSVR